MRVSELDTPTLLVDLNRLQTNLQRMAQYAKSADLALRPHVKTHKTIEIAKLQMEHGAVGITVAKVGEAEVMAEAGIGDIFIANQIVGAPKLERLVALAKRAKISVGLDSLDMAVPLSSAFVQEGMRLPVLIEVDIGLGRCGVQPEAVAELAKRLNALGGLNLVGLFSYAGQVYMARNENEVAGIAAHEARTMGMLAERLRPLTQGDLRVSGGATPTARHYTPMCGLTEIRPGTYAFNDRTQLARWAATPNDCALTVLATVVSTPAPGRAVLDAGSKALCTDGACESPGNGMLKEDNQAIVARVNEEHGFLDVSNASIKLRVGDKVEVIPNHCCTVANMFPEMVAVRAGEVVETWRVAARDRLR
jgi:D-serine deaminase-like pyridoxal phosphate-dependent protein